MPWTTPTLREVRSLVRDHIRGTLPGADATIGNSVLRVVSDVCGALCHLVLQYVDWLARQLMPDTAETEWLDRHGDIWLTNADGTRGRKIATLASGHVFVTATTIAGVPLPRGSQITKNIAGGIIGYETTEAITVGDVASPVAVRALDPGSDGNCDPGDILRLVAPPVGIVSTVVVDSIDGGTDEENDDYLRGRVLERIQQPPMGGAENDYVGWALAIPGVTRAWAFALEMGIGTVTVRFMMDELRADNGGFPTPADVETVRNYLDAKRPVAVKDFFVEAPTPFPIDLLITDLTSDDAATRAAITESLQRVFLLRSKPGQFWWRAWLDEGILNASGVVSYDLTAEDTPMPNNGYMPVLGNVRYIASR